MSKRALLPLPEILNPSGFKCVTVRVPNDRQHIANFFGALYQLTAWNSYDRDDAHRALIAANRWRSEFERLVLADCTLTGDGEMQFRQNGCKLEYSLDCVTWNTLYDPTGCFAPGVTQPPAGGVLAEGDCVEYDVALYANNTWMLPIPVNDGYTITVSPAIGAWNDGGSPNWYCPDGVPFVLGVCVGSGAPVGGDPAPLVDHMRLIAVLGTGQTIDAYDNTFTLPGGTGATSLKFQANDSAIGNNLGSIHFHVKVCATAVPSWCYTFNFLTSDGGWAGYDDAAPVWTSGLGWVGGGANADRTYLNKAVSASSHINTLTAVFASAFVSGDNIALQWFVDGVLDGLPIPFVGGPSVLITIDKDITSTFKTAFERTSPDTPIAYLESMTFRGTGVNPFGSDNCT